MRVLFTGHLSLDTWPQGGWLCDLGKALVWAGHEVRGLVTAGKVGGNDPFPVARVVCRAGDPAADLDFDPPCFASEGGSSQTFESLTDDQIRRYREAWRRRLDREVDDFNPHVIHAANLWWEAQLALETGVPYVVSAWSAELTACADHEQTRALVQQAAENASRIFVPHRALGQAVEAAFGIAPDHIVMLQPAIAAASYSVHNPVPERQALLARFGIPNDSRPLVVVRATADVDSGLDLVVNAAARCEATSESAAVVPRIVVASAAAPNPLAAAQAARLGLMHFMQVQVGAAAQWQALWQAADLALFPSRRPADGLDVIWALAAGTPAIVTAASGLDCLAGCPAVRSIAADDHELLADAILAALGESWKEAQGAAAADFVRHRHAIATAAEHVAEAYRSVLTQRFGHLPPH
ncbi:MAG TPA: glycosyltransferase [Pirellulales bacterium]|nr:glycosyltransferase [Pirellulales bacterium]